MAEDMMNEEMTGMAAPAPEAMEEPMTAEDTTPVEEKQPSIDMETMMGNFMDMTDDERKIVGRLIASPAGQLIDQVFGEPLIARLATQLDQGLSLAEEEEAPAAEGMMAPSTEPMADMPTEEEEATPPV
jgi:hypothetical protein